MIITLTLLLFLFNWRALSVVSLYLCDDISQTLSLVGVVSSIVGKQAQNKVLETLWSESEWEGVFDEAIWQLCRPISPEVSMSWCSYC